MSVSIWIVMFIWVNSKLIAVADDVFGQAIQSASVQV